MTAEVDENARHGFARMFATKRGKWRAGLVLQKVEGSVTEAVCRCRHYSGADNLVLGTSEPNRFVSRVVEAAASVDAQLERK